MQFSLIAALIPILNLIWCGVSADNCNLSSISLDYGSSQTCVIALESCSNNSANVSKEVTTLTEVKSLLQEVKAEQENERKKSDAILDKLVTLTNSQSEIKTILQELKMELENARKGSDSGVNITADNAKQNSETLPTNVTLQETMGPRRNCADLRAMGDQMSGVRALTFDGDLNPKQVTVYCDQETDEGGWTVFQNRDVLPERENFERSWQEYVEGFGDPKGEYWLGLDNLHALTSSAPMELRIDLEDWDGLRSWAKYETFNVGNASTKYLLRIAGYSGDAGDEGYGMSYHDGSTFSTFDQDNDLHPSLNCAEVHRGGWWFEACSRVHLNGLPHEGYYTASHGEGIYWYMYLYRGWSYSLKKTSMKLRPLSRG